MKVLRTVDELRAALAPTRIQARRIGLVPTMGALHEGHRSLIAQARADCDVVVVSLFVNPSQFNDAGDLENYPRREHEDRRLAEQTGADILFAPSVEEVYPVGFATSVEVLGVTERLEGASRGAAHFRGVATVVTKLLCMVGPDRAYFGQKDAQQLVVIRRLASDLNLPVLIEGCPTVREPDGLALSSRNTLLDPDQRRRAPALWQALQAAGTLAADGETSAPALLDAARAPLARAGIEPEYLALVDTDTFEPLTVLTDQGLLTIAARLGDVRLIDNTLIRAAVGPSHDPSRDRKDLARCSA